MALSVKDTNFERLYTAQEFEKMPQFHERYELLDGRLVEKPVPHYDHSEIADIIRLAVHDFDPQEGAGKMRLEVSVSLRPDYGPLPDLSYWITGRIPSRKSVGAAPRPDLAIEIQSPGQSFKSLETKAVEYLKAGVRIVWIVVPGKQEVKVFRAGQTRPETIGLEGKLDGEDVIKGFSLPVAALFEGD